MVGDPHGCYDEFHELLKKFEWKMSADILVVTGDLVDRGPKIYELVNFVRYIDNVYTVEGNHEEKIKRALWGRPVKLGHAHRMTLDAFAWEIGDARRCGELIKWFEGLPHVIRVTDDIYVVHAGMHPDYDVEAQGFQDCIRIRTVEDDGHVVPWWEEWKGPTILFGHNVQPECRVAHNAYALDGGCVYGGELRGIEVINGVVGRVLSVAAKQVYYDRRRIAYDEA